MAPAKVAREGEARVSGRSPTRQLPLPLPFRPALSRADFILADSNRDAVNWLVMEGGCRSLAWVAALPRDE